jgi:ubiquinone biosynthesis protein
LTDSRIGLMDAGMVGRIDAAFQRQVVDILMAAGSRDAPRLTDAVLRVCGTPDDLDRGALSNDLTELFEEFGTQDVGQFDVSGALNKIIGILHQHKLALPGNLSMLIKVLILLEGTGRLLSPQFNLAELLEPWRKKWVWRRLSPWTQMKELGRLFSDWERTAEALPRIVTRLIDRLERGNFAIQLEHQHLKSAANRLVVGLIVSSLLIASAFMIAHDVPPRIHGVSVIGFLGYIGAVAFGIRTIWINRDHLVSRKHGDWE